MFETEGTGREIKDQVISINRVTKVVKGGKNLSFRALVVVGDRQGRVGYGMGKAKEVPAAIKKGVDKAKRDMIEVPMSGSTVPHAVMGTFGSGRVMIKPAQEGTGVIAGVSTLKLDGKRVKNGGNVAAAKLAGQMIAKQALEKGVETVVFDRGGYIYHGRVKALAEAAREAGLRI